jgi:hypothetical protein
MMLVTGRPALEVGAPRRSPVWLARLVAASGPAMAVVRSACTSSSAGRRATRRSIPGIPAAVAATGR